MLKRAFTLAEVLITLTIIGVVAAITIPSVIANANQQEYKTGLKKAVSSLDQAVALNIAVEGDTPFDNSDILGYLKRHMSVGANGSGDYRNGIANYSRGWRRTMQNQGFYTKDGMRYEVFVGQFPFNLYESGQSNWSANGGHCGDRGMGGPNDNNGYPCVIMVDVNGDRKPHPNDNTWGEMYPSPYGERYTDIFTVLITDKGAVPYGTLAQKIMYHSK